MQKLELSKLSKMSLLENILICNCANGDLEKVESLLKAGVNPNIKPNNSPLATAINCFQPEVIKLLLKYGADPNGIVCSTGLQLVGYIYPLDLAQYCYLNSFMSAEAIDIIYETLLDNGSYKMNKRDCLTLQWMIQERKEKRIKERTKAYYYTSLCLPRDLARMVAECF